MASNPAYDELRLRAQIERELVDTIHLQQYGTLARVYGCTSHRISVYTGNCRYCGTYMGGPICYRLGDGEDGTFAVGASDRLLRYTDDRFYRGYHIEYDPPPIPDRRFDYGFSHVEYGGPGDPRCGRARSVEEAKSEIDMLYEDEGD
jgi:hypothetical protein